MKLAEEDPTFKVKTDEETGQTLIGGMGELHLEIIVDRLKREFKVEANVGKPQVAYRESLKKPVEKVEYRHKKQTGGSGQYGHVVINVAPLTDADREEYELDDDVHYHFESKIVGGSIPKEYIPAVDKGIRDSLENGVLAGYPLVDVLRRAHRRQLPRRGLLGGRVQDHRLDGLQGGRTPGRCPAARARDGRRGRHPRRLHG